MIPINTLGIKNFRFFDNNEGFLENLDSINILTGTNSSGKSSVIKFLQLLQNSKRNFPFKLDLTEQEHFLGDFKNVMNNQEEKNFTFSLPFYFFGIKNFYIKLKYELNNTSIYFAVLRDIKVIDKESDDVFFLFHIKMPQNQIGNNMKKSLLKN